jgi:lipopolysaccharide/colanic/teichoic acid biosynthesis glycosyltransferase
MVGRDAMERAVLRTPDVAQAAERLRRPVLRVALVAKRGLDVLLAVLALIALLPVIVLMVVAHLGDDGGWVERQERLGRDGRPVALLRFRALSGGLGHALDRLGARDVLLLFAVLRGQLSFVGPRALAPGTEAGHTGPRRLMAPGLTGPAQRWAADPDSAAQLDDAYVARWSLAGDLRLLSGAARRRTPTPS